MKDYLIGEIILIDKPKTWTSFDVVAKIRNTIKIKKIGHAGTLDPMATGLLILCTGKLTKKIDEFQAQVKEYKGEMTLGMTTPSYDGETECDASFPFSHIDEALIKNSIPQFTGKILQRPPIYSAIKIDGKRLYELARKGKTIDIPEREVEIFSFEITKISLPKLEFKVICSKGTYIRSLVHDFGKSLNSGAYMSELRRTKIGEFRVDDAQTIDDFMIEFKIMSN